MYGLIGKKINHSFSANYFNKKFKDEGIDEVYELFPLPSIEEFPALLESHPDLKGLNVTIPYKQEVIKYLDGLSEECRQIGAVNVIKFNRKDDKLTLIGYNSDYIGFKDSLIPLITKDIKNALVLGTGGASKAVCYVLETLGINYKLVSRDPSKGDLTYSQLDKEIIENNLLIVNTTPLGMFPEIDSFPPIPYQFLTPRHVCYDLVYNPMETKFMKLSQAHGSKVKNGLEMLHLQAVGAWEIWNK